MFWPQDEIAGHLMICMVQVNLQSVSCQQQFILKILMHIFQYLHTDIQFWAIRVKLLVQLQLLTPIYIRKKYILRPPQDFLPPKKVRTNIYFVFSWIYTIIGNNADFSNIGLPMASWRPTNQLKKKLNDRALSDHIRLSMCVFHSKWL